MIDDEIIDYEEMVQTPEGLKSYLKNCFKEIYKLFEDSGYFPRTLDEVNYYLKQNIFQLDKLKNTLGVYTKNNHEKSIVINSDNYFCGYYHQIWQNLTFTERAQVIYWHFLHKQQQLRTKFDVRFIPTYAIINETEALGCIYGPSENLKFYLNLNTLFTDNPLELIYTIEHECEHIKQTLNENFLKKRHKKPSNIYELSNYWDTEYLEFHDGDYYTNYGLYISHISETSADKRAFKNIIKMFKNMKEVYGIHDVKQSQILKEFFNDIKSEKGMLNQQVFNKQYKNDPTIQKKYSNIYNIVKNAEYLNKINIIKAYHWHHNNISHVGKCNKALKKFFSHNITQNDFIDEEWPKMFNRTKGYNDVYDNIKEEKNEE